MDNKQDMMDKLLEEMVLLENPEVVASGLSLLLKLLKKYSILLILVSH
jgi:hypothetical protein